MWPQQIREEVLVACGRRCCVCHRFCGLKMELHHIVPEPKGGKTEKENCIPLCFDCHAEAGYYNPDHPKGTKYSPSELRKHRDQWYRSMLELSKREIEESKQDYPDKIYEGQVITLKGFVWRETLAGRPNYSSLELDEKETYWMLILPKPINLFATAMEHGNTIEISDIKKVQLLVNSDFYKDNRNIVLHDVHVKGRLFQSMTGHHHGDALFEVLMVN